MGAGADFGHPLAQGRDNDLAADDHGGRQGQPEVAMFLHQQDQGDGDHEFIGHRVKERAEWRALLQAARQVAVEPVGCGSEGKHRTGGGVAPFVGQIEQQNENRDKQDA